jgi:hypothetical protein
MDIVKIILFIFCFVPTGLLSQTARVPLPLENNNIITDEYSNPLNKYNLIYVLEFNNKIYPPEYDTGNPNTNNKILFTTKVGAGVSNPFEANGKFFTSIIPRPIEPFFVRVYNSSNVLDSSFYEDSEVFVPDIMLDIAFFPTLNSTTNPIDFNDDDFDGIINSWEKSLNLNMYSVDTDGDNVNDNVELLLGTNPLDPDSKPIFALKFIDQNTIGIQWDYESTNNPNNLINSITQTNNPYDNYKYYLQMTEVLNSIWKSIYSGMVSDWPVILYLPDVTNNYMFYRAVIEQE